MELREQLQATLGWKNADPDLQPQMADVK